MTKSVKPGAGHMLVEELKPDQETQLISGSSLEMSGANPHDTLKIGRVIDKGREIWRDGRYHDPPAAEGDLVAFQSLSAHKLRLGGKLYLLVEFDHIKATVKEPK